MSYVITKVESGGRFQPAASVVTWVVSDGISTIATFYREEHASLFVDALTASHEPLVKKHMAARRAEDMRSLE